MSSSNSFSNKNGRKPLLWILLAIAFVGKSEFFVCGFRAASTSSNNFAYAKERNSVHCNRCKSLLSGDSPFPSESPSADDKNAIATKLLETCRKYGQIGSTMPEGQREEIETIVASISKFSGAAPAKIALQGTHELVYSAAKGGSSGKIGPFVGRVSQSFPTDKKFINKVEFLNGMFKIELHAERQVLDQRRIKVVFKETAVSLLGNGIVRKEVKGSGVWSYEFCGEVTVPKKRGGGEEKLLLRVMRVPSTFVIVQRQGNDC